MSFNILPYVTIKAVSMTAQEIVELLEKEGLSLVKIIEIGDNYIFCECKEIKFPWKRVDLAIDSDQNVIIAPT